MSPPSSTRRLWLVQAGAALLAACGGGGADGPEAVLARAIREDPRPAAVRAMARALVARELTAGTVYPAVFIRDLATFLELAIEAHGPDRVRAQLAQFLVHQGTDGNVPDGIQVSDGVTFKGTVESDQESSLVQAVARYVAVTGDRAWLLEPVAGEAVITRLERAIDYLYAERWSARYGLVWGGTRADWGDVQPEDVPGVDLSELSHPSIGIYDNAMLVLALVDLQGLLAAAGRDGTRWAAREQALRAAVRTGLWTGSQFVPHLYLDRGSPFPADFDESPIYFQGGTAVAIEAGLLQPAEVAQAFARMIRNKRDSGSGTVGVTVYPPYPAGFFANTAFMGQPYQYQNGGDWAWFGARIVRQMLAWGQAQTAWDELVPMLDRVRRDGGFYEWYTPGGAPRGSADYRGTAGQLVRAIDALQAWAASR